MLLHSASGLVHKVNNQDPRHTLGTHCVEGFVVTTDNHQKDKIQTIPRHVQQYKTSVTISLVRYHGLLYQMQQRGPTAAVS